MKSSNSFPQKKIKYRIGPKRPGDSKLVVANPDKFNKIMNWKPKYDFNDYVND